MNRKQLRTVTN